VDDPARTPLVSGSRLLFWPLAITALPATIALPFAWSVWTVRGMLALVSVEAALLSLVLVWRDPLRFHWAGRALLSLGAVWLWAVALGVTETADAWGDRAIALALSLPCAFYALTGRFERRREPYEVRRERYGELALEGHRLLHRAPRVEDGWQLDVDQIVVVGEYTFEAWDDDYRICFLPDPGGAWLEASFYAAGCSEALEQLGERLGAPLDNGLCNSTTFRSRVLWPPELRGRPLFETRPRHAPRRLVERALEMAGLRGDAIVVSPDVLEHVRRPSSR
jgi:hypothetical protein